MTRTRIAPSPTGYAHIGTIFQALINYSLAKKDMGKFIVRIEDTDQNRMVEGAEEAIFSALDFFELHPDESPRQGGPFAPYRQSERLDIYKKYALQLVDSNLAYYCFCTPERLEKVRKEMKQKGKPPMYDKHCSSLDSKVAKNRAKTEKHVIRMKIPQNEMIVFKDLLRGEISISCNLIDDQVLIKSDGFPTYHLAVVVDDHLMEITHIVRGEEWISSTPKHLLLYRYFGWKMPQVVHTPLLRNPDKSKLSKRQGHTEVGWYINQGYLKEAVLNFLATRVWNHPEGKEIFDLEEFVKFFNIDDMHYQGPIVDLDKLNWYQGQWIRMMSNKELLSRLDAYRPEYLSVEKLVKILPLIKDRLVKLSELESLTSYFVQEPVIEMDAILKESKTSVQETKNYIGKVRDVLEKVEDWTAPNLEKVLHDLQVEVDWKPRPAFMTIRLAVTGRSATPPLFETLEVMGREVVVGRLSTINQ